MVEIEHLSDKAKQDLILVEAAKKGNQAAYAELMDRYRESIYFMMFKMVKHADDADDLTIEAFGKAFRRMGQYTPQFAFFCNLPQYVNEPYKRFLEKKLRERFDFSGVPINLFFRSKNKEDK